MNSKIVFLGTGGDSIVVGKQIRSSGGIIIQSGDLQFHIDPGPGALVKAAENGINIRANTAIFVSNNNLLDCNDVNAVIDAMTYGGIDKNGVLVANQSLINGTDKEKPYLTEFHKSCVEKIIVLDPGKRVGIEDVEIVALPIKNPDPTAVGFKFLMPDFTLSYIPNTSYLRELIDECKHSDILILNVVAPADEKEENCLNTDEAIKIIEKINPKLAIITHFGIKMIKADPLYEGRIIQKKTGVQILAAKDGMVITPSSYSAKSKQKRLNLFEDKNIEEKENKKEIQEQEQFIENTEEYKESKEHQEQLEF